MRFDEYIEKSYDRMKQHIKRFAEGRKLPWDEDVFHDTLLKIRNIEQRQGKMADDTEKGFDNYLFMAYRTNALRELQYPRVSRTIYTDNFSERPDIDDDMTDSPSTRLEEFLRSRHGDTLTDLYLRKANGELVRDLAEESGISDLAKHFRMMADDARNNKHLIIKPYVTD